MKTSETRGRAAQGPTSEQASSNVVRYTETDIWRLEREDLTDLTVIATLTAAYRQNDPNEEEFFPGFRRDPSRSLIGTDESFERRIAEAETVLESNSTGYMARTKRLYAMAGREMTRRRDELREQDPELCDTRWQIPKPKG